MRILLLISLIVVAGCRQSPYLFLSDATARQTCIETFRPKFKTVLYNSHINVVGKHLSGLLLIKTMPDSSKRVVFTNEMGVKFFDFEFTSTGFNVKYVIKQLNKKVVINELKKDIGLVLFYNLKMTDIKYQNSENELYFGFKSGKEINYYITDKNCEHLLKIENASAKKKKMTIDLTDYKAGLPDSVYITHHNFEFNISLKQIER